MEWSLSAQKALRRNRRRDGIERQDQVLCFQPDLQSSLAAIDVDKAVRKRLFFNDCGIYASGRMG